MKPGEASIEPIQSRNLNIKPFQPFYETILMCLPGPSSLIWKVCLSVLLGLVFLIALFLTIGEEIFNNWSWLLSVMIATSTLLLYYATYTLRGLFPQMDGRLHRRGQPFKREEQDYFRTVKTSLSDPRFALWGVFFGTLNCVMGALFGVPYPDLASRLTTFSAFFIVGFICGMAALGIYGVLNAVKKFIDAEKLEIHYAAPDGCGGMLFLGKGLVKFSSVTLLMGVLIAIFIVNFPWTMQGNIMVKGMMWFWIAFPFFLSLLVLLAPSAEINRLLSDYKIQKEGEIDERLEELRIRIDSNELTASDRDVARKDYEYYTTLRSKVYQMRTWPFGLSSSVQYAAVFLTNAGAVVWKGVLKLIGIG